MIVRTLAQILGTDRDVAGRGWASRSLLLPGLFPARHAGPRRSELTIWYQHHLEACYRVEGVGEMVVQPTGRVHPVCGFDLHYWKGEPDLEKRGRKLPLHTGHERMGTVAKLGAGVAPTRPTTSARRCR